jgi:hypothetical protein
MGSMHPLSLSLSQARGDEFDPHLEPRGPTGRSWRGSSQRMREIEGSGRRREMNGTEPSAQAPIAAKHRMSVVVPIV